MDRPAHMHTRHTWYTQHHDHTRHVSGLHTLCLWSIQSRHAWWCPELKDRGKVYAIVATLLLPFTRRGGAKQLTCGFSNVVLLDSSSAQNDPMITCKIVCHFKRPDHALRCPPGTQTCAMVHKRPLCVPRRREGEKTIYARGKRRVNVTKNIHKVATVSYTHLTLPTKA